jgi:hypothetical protein
MRHSLAKRVTAPEVSHFKVDAALRRDESRQPAEDGDVGRLRSASKLPCRKTSFSSWMKQGLIVRLGRSQKPATTTASAPG